MDHIYELQLHYVSHRHRQEEVFTLQQKAGRPVSDWKGLCKKKYK